MASSCRRLRNPVVLAPCIAAAVVLSVAPHAAIGDPIRIWKVGSPYRRDTPRATVPFNFERESTTRGFQLTVEAFPAKNFAATFFDAVARNAAPDVIVFDNFGVMDGITTPLGRFEGIGQEPTLRQQFIRVTGAFDELLGPERGWTYLFALSPNHAAARILASKPPRCPNGPPAPPLYGGLEQIVPTVAAAHLEGDLGVVQSYADPERLPSTRPRRETIKAGGIQPCGVWGNEKLAIASVNAAYDANTTLGHTRLLLVLRKPSVQWQLLVAARDPISNDEFMRDASRLGSLLTPEQQVRALPIPAMLLSPITGELPLPASGQRFGTFVWQSSASDDVVAEIAEFAYEDDARLFLSRPRRPAGRGELSTGRLWTTRGEWYWRVWSISRAGDVAFSEARTFTH